MYWCATLQGFARKTNLGGKNCRPGLIIEVDLVTAARGIMCQHGVAVRLDSGESRKMPSSGSTSSKDTLYQAVQHVNSGKWGPLTSKLCTTDR